MKDKTKIQVTPMDTKIIDFKEHELKYLSNKQKELFESEPELLIPGGYSGYIGKDIYFEYILLTCHYQ